MNEPLYQIASRYKKAYLALADLDVPEEAIKDTLEALEGEVEEKVINVAKFIGNIEAQAQQIDDAIKSMQVRKKALQTKSDRIKHYLKDNMEKTGITDISCPFFDVKLKRNPPLVVIIDEKKIPEKYKTKKTSTSINKAEIKKDGGCNGAEIQQHMRVEIK